MKTIRCLLTALCLSLGMAVPATFAQVSVGVSIGINVPAYPRLVAVPGYPVYYAPGLATNFFFYDGLYWVFIDDNWYESAWYNGPWVLVAPQFVPLYILRVPVRYYRAPPPYFHAWAANAPPPCGMAVMGQRQPGQRAAALGSALGACVGTAPSGLGPLESRSGAAPRAAAHLPAAVCRRALPARGTAAAGPAQPTLSLPAERARCAAAPRADERACGASTTAACRCAAPAARRGGDAAARAAAASGSAWRAAQASARSRPRRRKEPRQRQARRGREIAAARGR